jgi:hypothetical protein
MPRAFSSFAISVVDLIPASRMLSTIGSILAANASAARAHRDASERFRR